MPSPSQSIFISYARKDGRAFARRLRTELEPLGFSLWHDVVDMEAGEQWWPQIEEAIRGSAVMVLTLTEAALSSRVVGDEWTYARTVGTYVIPIVEDADLIPKAPEWIRKVDIVNIDGRDPDHQAARKRFLGLLRNPPPRRPRPFIAPGLPSRFVQRPREFSELAARIVDAGRAAPIALTTALQGGGGFGKTTLAIALCHDPRVRAIFDGGILWVQFTQSTSPGDALALLNDQIKLLDPDGPTFSEPTLASARFRELLSGRDVLVVLDDVWSESYLPLFVHKGPTYVITTRRQPVVAKAGAESVLVNQLETGEAAALLSRSLPRPPDEREAALLRDLAVRLGEWALLVDLVGAELGALTASGRTLPDAVAYVTQRLDRRGFGYLDRHQEGNRNTAIGDSLDASLTMLAPGLRDRFHELGILRGDADLPFQTIAQLWAATAGYDDLETDDALEAMQRLALFTRYDARARVLRLHDVIRRVVAGRLTDARSLNAKLVSRWSDLKHLPDEYAWRNVLFHLRDAERHDDVGRLLFDFDWIHAKLRAVGPVALIADYQSEAAEPDCRLLASAVTIAGQSLTDPEQLPVQLVGRLARLEGKSARVRDLLERAGTHESAPALLPKRVLLPSLPQGVHRTIAVGSPILSSVLSADTTHLLIGLETGTVQVWDWRRQERVASFECGVGPVRQMAVTGERLALGGRHDHDKSYARPAAPAQVWNWVSKELQYPLGDDEPSAQDGYATALGGSLLAMTTSESNNLIRIYDWTANGPAEIVDPEAVGAGLGAVGNRPGYPAIVGSYLLYSAGASRIGVWTTADRRFCGDISAALGERRVPFVADGRLLVGVNWFRRRPAGIHGFAYFFNEPADPHRAAALDFGQYDGDASAAAGSGAYLFVCSDLVKIVDSRSNVLVGVLEAHVGAITSVHPLEDALLTTARDGTIRIWDWPPAPETGSAIDPEQATGGTVRRFYRPSITAIAMEGQSVFVGTHEALEEWNWATAVMQDSAAQQDPVRALAVSDTWVLFSRFDKIKRGHLRRLPRGEWMVERQMELTWKREGFEVWNGTFDFLDRGAVAVALCGDACAAVVRPGYFATSQLGLDQYVTDCIYVLDLLREECELVGGEFISAVALSLDLVAGGRFDGDVDIWQRATADPIARLSGHSGRVTALAIQGPHLLSASDDGTVQVWDVQTFAGLRTLRPGAAVNALCVRGGLLVTACEDHTLRLFDWRSGAEFAQFTDDAPLVACAIADDAETILAGGKSGQLHIFRPNELLRRALMTLRA